MGTGAAKELNIKGNKVNPLSEKQLPPAFLPSLLLNPYPYSLSPSLKQ